MIINGKYVDYTLASLLKEKGFDEKIETLITPENKVYFLDENSVTNLKHIKISNSNTNPYSNDVSCPDLLDVMKWIRERYGYVISIEYQPECSTFKWRIYKYDTTTINPEKHTNFEHYKIFEECVEAVINYSLKYLILNDCKDKKEVSSKGN